VSKGGDEVKKKSRALGARHFIIPCIGLTLGGCALVGNNDRSVDDPGSAAWQEARYQRAKATFSLGNYGLSLEAFRDVLRYAPHSNKSLNSTKSLNGLAASYDMLGRHDLAQRYYKEALLLEPKSVDTLNNQGYSYILAGKFDKARQSLLKAAQYDEKNSKVLANLKLLNHREVAAKALRVDSEPPFVDKAENPPSPEKKKMWVERVSESVQVLVTRPFSALARWAQANNIAPRWLHNPKAVLRDSDVPPRVLSVSARDISSKAITVDLDRTSNITQLPPVVAAPRPIVSPPQFLERSSAPVEVSGLTLKKVSGTALSSGGASAMNLNKRPIEVSAERGSKTKAKLAKPSREVNLKVAPRFSDSRPEILGLPSTQAASLSRPLEKVSGAALSSARPSANNEIEKPLEVSVVRGDKMTAKLAKPSREVNLKVAPRFSDSRPEILGVPSTQAASLSRPLKKVSGAGLSSARLPVNNKIEKPLEVSVVRGDKTTVKLAKPSRDVVLRVRNSDHHSGRSESVIESSAKAVKRDDKDLKASEILKLSNRPEVAAKLLQVDSAPRVVGKGEYNSPIKEKNTWVERASQGVQVFVTRTYSALVQWAQEIQIVPRRHQNPKVVSRNPHAFTPVSSLGSGGAGSTPETVQLSKPNELTSVVPVPSSIAAPAEILEFPSDKTEDSNVALKKVSDISMTPNKRLLIQASP
jgi:tetratricopeptide (TPR) repeat protein